MGATVADRLIVDAGALARLLDAAARHPHPQVRTALVALVTSGTAPAPPDPTPWCSVDEAARLLGVSERTVRRQVARGRLEHRREGRRLLIATRCLAPNGPMRTREDTRSDNRCAGRHGDHQQGDQRR